MPATRPSRTGSFPQRTTLLVTSANEPVNLENTYHGRSCFLICGGPSFGKRDVATLNQPGVLTMAVNNSVKTFRPDLWTCADSPDRFLRSIWLDPKIVKFAPHKYVNAHIFDSDKWQFTASRVKDCPATFYYHRNAEFNAESFLVEPTINWGNDNTHGGARSVMPVAIRLLYYLGVRRIFLLGCDFKMTATYCYHFAQGRGSKSIQTNNYVYQVLSERFKQLRPILEAGGLRIYNCNPRSKLEVFEKIDFNKAIAMCLKEWGGINVATERTAGLYDMPKPQPPQVAQAVLTSFRPGLTVITCTRNRPEAFRLLERWMRRQTRKWNQWIVVNDGRQRYDYTLGQEVVERVPVHGEGHSLAANLLAALARIRHEHIVFVEDDDWIGPKYLESMYDSLKKASLVGNVPALYYNVATGRWQNMKNRAHASLGQTALEAKALPLFAEIVGRDVPQMDIALWREWRGKKKFIPSTGLHVGIKGMPGENGIGVGHHADFGKPDPKLGFGMLRKWIGEDVDAYLRPKLPKGASTTTSPRIGCVITCHNYGRYLRECIESCLAQTVRFATIVVVDDASTDNTAPVAKKFAVHDQLRQIRPIIAYERVNYRDVGQARNAGYSKLLSLEPNLTHAIFVDADNTLVPDCVATLLPKLDDVRVGVAYGNLLYFGDRSGISPHVKPWSPHGMDQYNIVDACALVRREALDQLGGWVGHVMRMEDWLTWLRIEANGWKFAFTPTVTVRYRVHRGQKSEHIDQDLEAVRCAWRIAVVTPFSGRWWSLDRYADVLRSLDWPRENLFIVAVDNSGSVTFGAALRSLLDRASIPHVLIPYAVTIDGTSGAAFSDDATKRTTQCYCFNMHVGRLWATARQFLPAWATHVLTLEDDIEPPSATLSKLAEALWMNRRAVMATGFARSRFDGGWMLFRNGQRLVPTSAVMEADRSGLYCALWRRSAFDSAVFAPSHALTAAARGYYDWIACDSARLDGGKILSVGGVVCKHWKADGTFL